MAREKVVVTEKNFQNRVDNLVKSPRWSWPTALTAHWIVVTENLRRKDINVEDVITGYVRQYELVKD